MTKRRESDYCGPAKKAEMLKAEIHANGVRQLADFKMAGVEWVEWITAGTGDSCQHCEQMNGKVMRLSDVKFSEHPDCDHESGCRCVWIAVDGPAKKPVDKEPKRRVKCPGISAVKIISKPKAVTAKKSGLYKGVDYGRGGIPTYKLD